MMSDDAGVLAWDGGRGTPPDVMPLVRRVLESGRTQIVRRQRLEDAGLPGLGELVLSPVRVDDRVVGTVGAFAGWVANTQWGLPAGLALILSGLGALGVVGARRKAAA